MGSEQLQHSHESIMQLTLFFSVNFTAFKCVFIAMSTPGASTQACGPTGEVHGAQSIGDRHAETRGKPAGVATSCYPAQSATLAHAPLCFEEGRVRNQTRQPRDPRTLAGCVPPGCLRHRAATSTERTRRDRSIMSTRPLRAR